MDNKTPNNYGLLAIAIVLLALIIALLIPLGKLISGIMTNDNPATKPTSLTQNETIKETEDEISTNESVNEETESTTTPTETEPTISETVPSETIPEESVEEETIPVTEPVTTTPPEPTDPPTEPTTKPTDPPTEQPTEVPTAPPTEPTETPTEPEQTKPSTPETTPDNTLNETGYYRSLLTAIDDINKNSVGKHSNAKKATASVYVYIDKNDATNVVLLKDINMTERIVLNVPIVLNLNGKVLTSTSSVAIDVYNGITIDGTTEGSEINVTNLIDSARTVQVRDGKLAINGGKYVINTEGVGTSNIYVAETVSGEIKNAEIVTKSRNSATCGIRCCSLTIDNCNIYTESENETSYCIAVTGGTNCEIKNCTMNSYTGNGLTVGIYILSNSTVSVKNCDVVAKTSPQSEIATSYGLINYGEAVLSDSSFIAHSNYNNGTEAEYSALSCGVANMSSGPLTCCNCYVFGTHSGLETYGPLYIDGGTFESFGHGGIYFANVNEKAYVKNATIRESDMPEGYSATCGGCFAGFYIGGGPDSHNITVYMDNCDIYGSKKPLVLRGTSGETNNSLYISNSRINDTKIRIDNNTHRLYIGEGNSFSAEDVAMSDEDLKFVVVATNENYSY